MAMVGRLAALGPVGPGARLGILGGGQLGRMTALAAARLGISCHIFTPEDNGPASQVCPMVTLAAYDDLDALSRFAASVDVITFEFENIPAASVAHLAALRPVRPGWKALETAQDRILEKRFFNDLGIATAPWAPVTDGPQSLAEAVAKIGCPAILKTTRLGYDGKGQVRLNAPGDSAAAWAALGNRPAVLEGLVPFVSEISVIIARAPDGATACFEPTLNHHREGILHTSSVPAPIRPQTAIAARAIAESAALALDLVGLLAVELFVLADGSLLVNEMAPRPHNSGHWTMDACHTDQFEQFVRAVCGLPLGDPSRFRAMRMTNLIGDEVHDWPLLMATPGARLHLYGKVESRRGRKMGHVNTPV
ncbi:5-(carboxyamino)imidazole ribonucleotide synthase [Rhodospirillum rubrum]|uniref:N5-carboxyaminoimidazole ribonucleotide synthase n=1 Tax=Rhodospirillum rubrum (strain ATCC 11170 / ATH 1.1.1 / DSM 467 / LMG 4362 / NCIMB 8255 / S1) TaxID=269796 RepID=Q2RVJ3_RHORT|nr:5-(carboxyamino)imidazole ribonucleotide synthase [Rhodospirillum rubrum]ABC21852.1 phosphoribosylaminoimidazole carboxylase [Rhodospirillum rubrum ATCC 11170]MBK5953415.1 5-(carboxyamino)imidazole ribonucleotide synthase [Rhodospirillum rubrum]HAQ01300.1 5-(carboxyamino)imidazole ribonucleotide synthase [Rhodospirillum rubrum]HCF18515.1 5-(carboxyamino)imidazole ribonucleotide synthase [Rhodospirillum rubrum]